MDEEKEKKEQEMSRQGSIRSIQSIEGNIPIAVEEQKGSGSVGLKVYMEYFKAGGNCCVIFTLFTLFFFTQILASISDYFITYW